MIHIGSDTAPGWNGSVAAVAQAELVGSSVGYDAYAVDLVIRTSRARVDAMAALAARLA